MGWFRDHLFVISLSVFVVSGVLSALVVGFLGLIVGSAFVSGSLSVGSLLDLWPYVPVLAVLLTATVLSGIGMGWSAIRRISLPRLGSRRFKNRLHPIVKNAEQKHSTLASLSLSEHVAPSEEEQLQQLKQQYVEGAINEAEFERRVERLTADNSRTDTLFGGRGRTQKEHER